MEGNPTSSEIPKKDENPFSVDIERNTLDQFELPTYHFRLFMMNDEAVRKKQFGPTSREHRIVIAESGVTSTEIDNVEIHSVVGMSKGAGIGISTNFSFTLTQPFGATLLDEIVNAANILGIENFAKAPYFLELSFRSQGVFDENNTVADSDFRDLIWVWPLIFTKMGIDVNAGGSTYTLEAALYGDMAYTNHISDLSETVNIDAETVGEFFKKFAAILNSREESKRGTSGYVFPDTFSFKIDEQIINEKIVPDGKEERQNRAGTFEEGEDGKMRISFQAPVSIDRVIQNVLSLTKFFQKKAKGTDDPDALKKDNQGEEAIFQTLYRVVADSEMGKYDSTRQDYQRHNKYLIIPYNMTTIQTQSNQNAAVTNKQRYDAIRRKGLITKVYDYIYTGLNDQVLDFELVFNFNWYAALPLQGGIHNKPVIAEIGASKTDQQANIEAGADSLADKAAVFADRIKAEFPSSLTSFSGWSLEDLFKSLVSTKVTDLQEAATTAVTADSLQVSDVIGEVTDGIETVQSGVLDIPETIPGINNVQFVPGISETIGGISIGQAFPIATTERMLAILQSKTQFPRIGSGGDSVDAAQQELKAVDPKLEDLNPGEKDVQIFKTSYIEAIPGKGPGAGTGEYASSPGQNMLSALFEQANSPLAADLLTIDLKIKGDPYWLEPSPIGRTDHPITAFERAEANRGGTGQATSFNGVDSTDSQTYFVFRSFTPQQFDAETGITPKNNKDRNALNGVYGVRTVTHSFSQGMFTQELHAIRDPQLNLQGIDIDAPLAAASAASDTDSIVSDADTTDQFSFSTGSTTLGLDAFERQSSSALPIDGLEVDVGGAIGSADRSSGDPDG